MNKDVNDFETLLQLLKLKRHETPPPGYFNNFSSQIIDRIRSDARVQSTTGPAVTTSWFSNFLQLFEFKPAFAGALASALCLVVVFGVVYADRPDSGSQLFLQNSDPSVASYAALAPATVPVTSFADGMMASNNPAASLQPVSSVFDSGNALIQPASFSPAGR